MTKKNIQTALIVFVAGAAALFLVFRLLEPKTFPSLAPGAYLGTMTGFGLSRDESAQFYLERLPDSEVFIAVVFSDGFRPQALRAEHAPSGDGYLPLRLEREKGTVFLSGGRSGDAYQGKAVLQDVVFGRWTLRRVPTEQLVGAVGGRGEELGKWVEAKAEFRTLRRAMRQYEERVRAAREKSEKLTRFVQDEALLKERASRRRDTLAAERAAAFEERKQTTEMLRDLVSQLELVGRISKTGQAILLARRVANRENQWYLANWQSEEGAEFLEENLGTDASVDFQKLEQAVRGAEEIESLLRERDAERRKIEQLQTQLAGGISVIEPGSTDAPDSSEALPPARQVSESSSRDQRSVDAPVGPASEPRSNGQSGSQRGSLWDKLFE